jgi:tetratricopeptide (TPR) repeat protein
MVVYFFTDWCGYCKRIDRDLFSSVEVDRYFSRSAFRVRVNPEESASNRMLADRFGVNGYPSFFVVPTGSDEPDGCSLYRRGRRTEPISPAELAAEIEGRNASFGHRLLQQAAERRQAGDLDAAVSLLDSAVAAAPSRPDGWMQRAMAREASGALDAALSDYAVVAALRNDGSAHDHAVQALIAARRFDEAVACTTEWLEREPRSVKAITQRARAHAERGDEARSREDATRACVLGSGVACDAFGRS